MNRNAKNDTDRFPPAPVVAIKLTASETNLSTVDLAALLDTGADASFAPLHILESIQAGIGKIYRARSMWGEKQSFSSFIVDLHFDDITLPGIIMLGYDGDEVVLGRDILNKLWLGLDGPAQMLEVADKRPRRK